LDNTPKNAKFAYVYVEDKTYPGEGESSPHYIAPPDLLRYCTSSANIDGLFAYCGVAG
jgi:hypothetical protein